MKKIAVLIFIITCLTETGKTQNSSGLTKAGLTAELVRLKETSEAYAGKIMESDKFSKAQKEACLAKYRYLKMVSDQFIIQLITDLTIKNKPQIFKKLNAFFYDNAVLEPSGLDVSKADAKIKNYVEEYNRVFIASLQFYSCTSGTQNLTTPDPLDIITTVQGVIKDISEAKASKIEKLAKILDSLRLSSTNDLKDPKK